MADIAVFLFEQVGVLALLLIIGYFIDLISTREFKDDVNEWIKSHYKINYSQEWISHLLKSVLDGVMHRIYGSRIFSLKFVIRTCVVSILFLISAVVIQISFYSEEAIQQYRLIVNRPIDALILILSLTVTNFVVDYISNVTSISFLRMAAQSGKLFDTFLVFVADVTLTITIFSLIYPAGALVALTFNQSSNRSISADVFHGSKPVLMIYEDRLRKRLDLLNENFRDMELRTFYFQGITAASSTPVYTPTIALYYRKDSDLPNIVRDYLDFMKTLGVVVGHSINQSNSRLRLQIDIAPPLFSFDLLISLYYASYQNSNIMRDHIIKLIKMKPGGISVTKMYQDFVYSADFSPYPQKEMAGFKCTRFDHRDEKEGADIWMEKFHIIPWEDVVSDVKAEGCELSYVIMNMDEFDFWWDMLCVSSAGLELPIAPFFVTSFATSILYYMILLVLFVGGVTWRLLQRLYSTSYLNTREYPITILMTIPLTPVFIFVICRSVLSAF